MKKITDFILHVVLFFILFVILLLFVVFFAYPISPFSAIVILGILTLPTFLRWDTTILSIIGIIIYLLPYMMIEYSGKGVSFIAIWLLGIAIWELSVYISIMSPERWRRVKGLCRFWFLKMKRI